MPCQPGVRPPALIVTRTSVALGPPRSVSLPMGSPLPPTIGTSAVWTDAGCAKAGVQTAVANRAAEASAFIISFLQSPSSLRAERLSCEGPAGRLAPALPHRADRGMSTEILQGFDAMPRRRADLVLVERGLFDSRARAQAAIAAGLVTADGVAV